MTARSDGFDALALPDLERRSANQIRFGTVVAVDHANRRVRIKSGEIETAWLPWPAGRAAGGKRRWDPPEVGEQGVMLAPGGDLRQAVFMPGVYQGDYDAPSSDPNKDTAAYGDDTVIEYDRGTHTLLANLGDSSFTMNRSQIVLTIGATTLTMTAAGTTLATPQLTVDAAQSTFTGAVTVQGAFTYQAGMTGSGGSGANIAGPVAVTGGTVTHNGKNIGSTHTHSGVQAGGSTTGVPT
jgi:phage baseplate assembly protein V